MTIKNTSTPVVAWSGRTGFDNTGEQTPETAKATINQLLSSGMSPSYDPTIYKKKNKEEVVEPDFEEEKPKSQIARLPPELNFDDIWSVLFRYFIIVKMNELQNTS